MGLVLNSNIAYTGNIKDLPSIPLLDTVDFLGGFSLRKLTSKYLGKAIRVTRTSDSVQKDIGFVGKYLDTATLLEFANGGDVTVTTWYNQNNSGNNLAIVTAALQPKIVNAGVLVVDSKGNPSIQFNGTTNKLFNNKIGNLLAASVNICTLTSFKPLATAPSNTAHRRIINVATGANDINSKMTTKVRDTANTVQIGYRITDQSTETTISGTYDSSMNVDLAYVKNLTMGYKTNSNNVVTANLTSNTPLSSDNSASFMLGSSNIAVDSSTNFQGIISEVILFNTAISDSILLNIQQKMIDFYR